MRDILYANEEITKYFNEESIHVLDYDLEFEKGYLDPEVFPEYKNKFWSFLLLNQDSSILILAIAKAISNSEI